MEEKRKEEITKMILELDDIDPASDYPEKFSEFISKSEWESSTLEHKIYLLKRLKEDLMQILLEKKSMGPFD